MMIQVRRVDLQPFGVVELNVNQQIILEYHGELKVENFMVKITMVKPDNTSLSIIQTTEPEKVLEYVSKMNPKALN